MCTRLQRWVLRTITLGALGILVGHFFLVWLYLTPTNPLKIALMYEVNAYIHPLFVQNWQLFAPAPVAHDELMFVKVRWRDHASQRKWESGWMDITTPVHQAIHRTRVGPHSKLARPFSGIHEMSDYTDPIAHAMRERAIARWKASAVARLKANPSDGPLPRLPTKSQVDSAFRLSAPEVEQRRLGREMIYRMASAYAARSVEPQGTVLAVNVRFAIREFPRFSERFRSDSVATTRYTTAYGWERARNDVARLP